jgi:hypothetical protein
MIAIETRLNRRLLCVAGASDLSLLHATLTVRGKIGPKTVPPESRVLGAVMDAGRVDWSLEIAGLTARGGTMHDEYLRWGNGARIDVGDAVRLRIVDIEPDEADRPDGASPLAASIDGESEKRLYEAAKEAYFRLRATYEPEFGQATV